MRTQSYSRQTGFTLIELAVVMVIIGLLTAGILGARGLILGARAKDAVAIVDDLRTATNLFRQRYGYLPGDWPFVAGAINGVTFGGGGGTNGNGAIEGIINAAGQATPGTEVAEAPWQLFSAGFLGRIDSNDTSRRIKTAYGSVHVATPAISGVVNYSTVNPTVRNVVVFFNLPCAVAEELDNKLDDGNILTGRALGNPCVSETVDRYAISL